MFPPVPSAAHTAGVRLMAAPGMVRCRWCQHDQRAPRDRPGEHWLVITCRWPTCGQPIVAPTAPAEVFARYRDGWPGRPARTWE